MKANFDPEILKYWFGHPLSDDVTIKMPYGVDLLHRPALHPIFSY